MRWVLSVLQARQGAAKTACKCCVTESVLSNIRLCSWGGSFVRKGLAGSHAVLERIVVGETGPGRERAGSDLSGEGLAVIASVLLPDTSGSHPEICCSPCLGGC